MYTLKDFITLKMNKLFCLEFDKKVELNIGDNIKCISKYKIIDINDNNCFVETIGKYNFRDFKKENKFSKYE